MERQQHTGPYFWIHSILEKDQVTQASDWAPVTLASNPIGCGRSLQAPLCHDTLIAACVSVFPSPGSASGTPGAPTLPLLDPTQGGSGAIPAPPSPPGQLCSPQLEKDDFTLPESSSMQYLHKYSPTPGTGVQNGRQAICGAVQPPTRPL